MKTRNWMVATAMLVASTWTNDLLAQEHLEALFKKCASMKDVVIEEVYRKNKETKKPERRITTIQFSKEKHPELVDEFLKAFSQDQEAAYRVSDSRKNGMAKSLLYQFAVGTSSISYSLNDHEGEYGYAKPGDPMFDREEEMEVSRSEKFDDK